MFENKPDWRLIKSNIDLVKIKIDSKIDSWKHDLLYGRLVSKETHERGSNMAEAFVAEAMGFLSENPTARLKPISPSREQMQLMHYLFDSIDDGTLRLEQTEGRVWGKDRTYISKFYKAETRNADNQKEEDLAERMVSWFNKKNVTVGVRWGINEPFPHGFSIFGNLGMKHPGTIDFITFQDQPMTAEQVNETLRIPEKDGSFDRNISVFDKGKRIIIDRRGMYEGKEVQMTEQYYLIGAFDGEKTNKTFWLYASNSDTNKTTTAQQRVRERQVATQRSSNR